MQPLPPAIHRVTGEGFKASPLTEEHRVGTRGGTGRRQERGAPLPWRSNSLNHRRAPDTVSGAPASAARSASDAFQIGDWLATATAKGGRVR